MIRNYRDRFYSKHRILSASDIYPNTLMQLYEENDEFRKLADKFIASNKYKPGDFGYWWIVKLGNEDIEGRECKIDIDCPTYLTSLYGAPQKVSSSYFSCYECNNLTSLEGAPREVSGDFSCSYCDNLTSLEGAPEKVGGNFDCRRCDNLTSLKGAPEYVGSEFDCHGCDNLISLEGAPRKVGGNFDCSYCENLSEEDIKQLRDYCDIRGIIKSDYGEF